MIFCYRHLYFKFSIPAGASLNEGSHSVMSIHEVTVETHRFLLPFARYLNHCINPSFSSHPLFSRNSL